MKNIQIIDSAENCTYSIFQVNESDFKKIFPTNGQNIEFIEDLQKRIGIVQLNTILEKIWQNPIRKAQIIGLHGTLFFKLQRYKAFYNSKKEEAINPMYINKYQRTLFKNYIP